MLQLMSYVYKRLTFQKVDTVHIEKRFDETLELAQTYRDGYNRTHYIEKKIETQELVEREDCFISRGIITSLNTEGGMLNREYIFNMDMAAHINLSEGQTVSYLAYKEDDQIKVCKILTIVQENWNEPVTEETIEEVRQQRPETFATISLVKKGFITHKRKDRVVVEVDDETFSFSLEDVEATFMPRIFDRVSLDCVAQRDPSLINEAGPQLKVLAIKPPINQQISGKITSLDQDNWGMISEKYFFYWDALTDDYRVVNEGDQVKADCIESESLEYEWRCLKVVLFESATECLADTSQLLAQINNDTMNVNGIEVTDEIVVEFNELNKSKDFTMKVKNTSDIDYKVLQSVFLGNKNDSQLTLIAPSRNASFFLRAGEEKKYHFRATSKFYGDATEKFYIKFSGPTGHFKIFRCIFVSVNDLEQVHSTIGTGPNVQRNRQYTKRIFTRDLTGVIPGVQLKRRANFVKKKFEQFTVLESLKKLVLEPSFSRSYVNESLDSAFSFFKETLNISNYTLMFHHLLYLEECEMFHNIRKYDMKSFFTREKDFLSLKVENIAESRPSIVLGDYIIATNPWDSKGGKGHQGVIHEVKFNRILMKFDEGFHSKYKNEDYEITFYFSRMSLRKQHHAIELAKQKLPTILFPNKITTIDKQINVILNIDNGELRRDDSVIPWYNPFLNIVQKQAVANILQGVARPMPYVIFGPPGTGKTVTLIETILQVIANIPHSRILVATPSNSSANLITQRIIESGVFKQGDFIRLVSENSVQRELIPEDIIRYCGTIDIAIDGTTKDDRKVTESGLTMNCSVKYLSYHRLLIGTCVTVGTLMQCDFPEGHFSHVIIDESGQCLETEIMIPITFVDKQNGQVILAGDPMQLGPIVLSSYAADRGLDQSYLVRLLDRIPYKADPERFQHRYDPRLVTKLIYNYRSLPSIMNVYSDLFYDKDLQALVNDVDSVELDILRKVSSILPNIKERDVTQGVIFYGVEGRSETCPDSPSWLNRAEANNVFHFLIKLIKMGFVADDIGIITPYTQQVKTIRLLLQSADIIQPKIGTVEEFQGQERKIILLSTVRTSRHQLQFDEKHSLGFVRSPKRMNVAISRARALLVIFGSPSLLARDENWKFLIKNCIQNKCSINCDPSIVNIQHDDHPVAYHDAEDVSQ